jgi:hypothetical protein
MIEETISIFASRRITVEITASEVTDRATKEEDTLELIEGNDLVNTARDLFEGTVVKVKSTEEKDH